MRNGPCKRALAGALVALIALLAGCGYHLRGSTRLPAGLSSIYVQAATSLVGDELGLVLSQGGATVVGNPKDAQVTLEVGAEQFLQRVLSVDPNTGKVGEYELAYALSFSLSARDGRVLLGDQRVSLVRDYVFDADAVIGKSREQAVLQVEMRRDAVLQILRRVSVALSR